MNEEFSRFILNLNPQLHSDSFYKQIFKIKSSKAEASFIQNEIDLIKKIFSHQNISKTVKCFMLEELLICHILGYDVSFCHIHAVQLAQLGNSVEKKLGYLASSLFFSKNEEFFLLLINCFLKDIQSGNFVLENLALSYLPFIHNNDILSTFLPIILSKTNDNRPVIIRGSFKCLFSFITYDSSKLDIIFPSLMTHFHHKDPNIVWLVTEIIRYSLNNNIDQSLFKDITILNHILKLLNQIINRKLANEYDYNSISMPWLTISLLQLIPKLVDLSTNSIRYSNVEDTLQLILFKTDTKSRIGLAIIYETIKVSLQFHFFTEEYNQHCSNHILRFFSSHNQNYKYIGIKLIKTYMINKNTTNLLDLNYIFIEFQNQNKTLRHAILDMLNIIAVDQNKNDIISRLLIFAPLYENLKSKIFETINQLLIKFSYDVSWLIDKIILILDNEKNIILTKVFDHIILNIIPISDNIFKKKLLKLSENQLQNWLKCLPKDLEFFIWVIGEYSNLDASFDYKNIVIILINVYYSWKYFSIDETIFICLSKLLPHIVDDEIVNKIKDFLPIEYVSYDSPNQLDKIEMDFSLSFLDEYIIQNINNLNNNNKNMLNTKSRSITPDSIEEN